MDEKGREGGTKYHGCTLGRQGVELDAAFGRHGVALAGDDYDARFCALRCGFLERGDEEFR